ncbi:sensor histidine kinase [uncultured Alteromonas sp.]|jgi:signal transduction histidine kinase|uniref:sensor histidine kinase n=1 Tax=uncultured Alteromonas sp. TaxID=179113 RepID=UPI0025D16843|nr:HAMP domain-containing sensor histidine kinase [uncultured Alteromonas sp.]
MPSQLTTYLLGGIFVVVITVMGTLVSQTLLKQDQVVSFEAPMQEFIDTLSRELDYNAYALSSLAQLFRSSESVEAHEFASYTSLLMSQFGNIVAMTYLAEPDNPATQKLTSTYWQAARSIENVKSFELMEKADVNKLYKRLSNPREAVASPIFTFAENRHYYAFVLQRVAEQQGFVGILVDAGYTLDQTLDIQINNGYSLFERESGLPSLVFSKHQQVIRGQEDVTSGDFVGTLNFFNRQWLVSTYQNKLFHHKAAYSIIPIAAFALSLLVVYLVLQALRLRAVNREKQSAFEDLQFAQQRLVENEKLSAMGGLVAGVAHEVNTPLGIGITSLSHLQEIMAELRDDYDQGRLDCDRFKEFMESGDEMVSLSLNNMHKASALVARFKKVDVISADASMSLETVAIAELVDNFIVRFYNEFPGSLVTIKADIDKSVLVHTYPDVIMDILNYLASNAVSHAFEPSQKHCEISITYPFREGNKQTNLLLFKDNGTGVDKALLKRIVDPFFTTCRGAGNAGLGLSVVYNLVKGKLNSDLNIYVDEGLALTFELHDLNK